MDVEFCNGEVWPLARGTEDVDFVKVIIDGGAMDDEVSYPSGGE